MLIVLRRSIWRPPASPRVSRFAKAAGHQTRSSSAALNACQPKHPIKLVALDVDGTLLDRDDQVHLRVTKAIRETVACGVPVLLSTGRSATSAHHLVNSGLSTPLPLSGGAFLGGALGYDAFGKVVRDIKLSPDVVRESLKLAETSGLTPVLYSRDQKFSATRDKWTDWAVDEANPAPKNVGKKALYARAGKVNLLCFMGEKSVVDAAAGELLNILEGSNSWLVRPYDFMVDIVPGTGASEADLGGKAAALDELCAMRGVLAESVMAVGDSGNDVDMFKWAGWAVAVGNATVEAKTAADVVVAANDDTIRPGVAQALEDYVISPAHL